ncbi:hypothetical protein HPULCUR_006566 [Helicostylum pulchrum]|uniref:PAS domain-containing protein n=1 Tax=Helicostylum pulchrum TaxID=562976 RepID=A0ABP9Y295_9FUNG
MDVNCIIIYDNTAQASVLFASESIHDVLGYTPEELTGHPGYRFTHPDEHEALALIHTANVNEQRMSSLTMYRSRHKNGTYVQTDVIIHYCYDSLITTTFIVHSQDCLKRRMRVNSADFAYFIQSDGTIQLNDSQEKTKHLRDFKDPWGKDKKLEKKTQEPRFCLILNRYTSNCTIVFATKMCEIVELNQFDCIGKSLYDFISPQDHENVSKQIELSKSNDLISKLRFHWITEENKLIYIEAVVSCTYDGLVMVSRLCPSFITE